MKTLKDISDANIQALKDKNNIAKALFSTLKGNIETELKNSKKSESDIILMLAKKYTENAKIVNTSESLIEIELLKPFMPLTLDIEQYDIIAKQIIEGQKYIVEEIKNGNTQKIGILTGCFIKEAKIKYPGYSIDSNIVKESINKML